jgi:hypothetical protein
MNAVARAGRWKRVITAASLYLFATRPAAADQPPADGGQPGRRYIIRGGSVMSLDPQVGDFAKADVLIEGKKILSVGTNLQAGGAAVIDATGRIVMPGFIDTPSSVRDGTAQLSGRRGPDLRQLGDGGREHDLLPVHTAHIRPRIPAAGCVHQ